MKARRVFPRAPQSNMQENTDPGQESTAKLTPREQDTDPGPVMNDSLLDPRTAENVR